MTRARRKAVLSVSFLIAAVLSAQESTERNHRATARLRTDSFGTGAYTVTTVSATAFYPDNGFRFSAYYGTDDTLGRYGDKAQLSEFYATLDLPGGAVIDYIGLNSAGDVDAAYGVDLRSRHKDGTSVSIGTFSSTAHGWGTDFNASPIGYVWPGTSGEVLIIDVEEAPTVDTPFFGWVEVWWRRAVSPPPAMASFNDVPTSHPFFQYVEALKASGITGGCSASPPLYCPDNPLTRGQMAVFLAKALGLSWPGN